MKPIRYPGIPGISTDADLSPNPHSLFDPNYLRERSSHSFPPRSVSWGITFGMLVAIVALLNMLVSEVRGLRTDLANGRPEAVQKP